MMTAGTWPHSFAENQIEQLQKAGCDQIYKENGNPGGKWDQPELEDRLKHLRRGDVVVVWELDRLGRSLIDLLRTLDKIENAGAGFRSLTEHVDTPTSAGRLMMSMLGSFTQFERDIIKEHTKLGLALR